MTELAESGASNSLSRPEHALLIGGRAGVTRLKHDSNTPGSARVHVPSVLHTPSRVSPRCRPIREASGPGGAGRRCASKADVNRASSVKVAYLVPEIPDSLRHSGGRHVTFSEKERGAAQHYAEKGESEEDEKRVLAQLHRILHPSDKFKTPQMKKGL